MVTLEVIIGVITVGGVLTLILFIFKNQGKRIDKAEVHMEEMVTEKNCQERHKYIDENLKQGKDTMNKLVELTTKMDKTLGIMAEKIDRIDKKSNGLNR